MRGRPENNGSLWYSITVEDLIEPGHPLRAMKRMVDETLSATEDGPVFSVVPRHATRAMRSLIRLSSQKIVTDSQSIGLIARFFDVVVQQAKDAGLTSDDHFTVDGSLIQSHASLKSLKRIESEAMARENATPDDDDPTTPPSGGAPSGGAPSGGAPGKRSRNESVAFGADFRGERRGNATHRSTKGSRRSTCAQGQQYRRISLSLGACADGESTWTRPCNCSRRSEWTCRARVRTRNG